MSTVADGYPSGEQGCADVSPHSDDSERIVLGAMMTGQAAAAEVRKIVADVDFYDERHAVIFRAITGNLDQGKPADFAAIGLTINPKELSRIGGVAYLHTCVAAAPLASDGTWHARQIADLAATRRTEVALAQVQAALRGGNRDSIDAANHRLQQSLAARSSADGWRSRIRLTPASTFKIRAVRWVWEGRMPAGELTLIPGREGVGKSTFLAWLAAAVTNGNLPGAHYGQPKSVLYAASEDSWDYTIAPRMMAAGADMDRVFRIDVVREGGPAGLILPRDCRDLPDVAREYDAAMLMCDPIMSLVDEKINNFKAQELRKALEPLRQAAEDGRFAVPALVHFNKGSGSDVGTLIAGARAWVEVARAVIAIARDKEDDEYTCVVSQTKNNLGKLDLPHLTYTIDSVTLEADDGEDAHVGRLRWTGETDRGVEDLLGQSPEEVKVGKTMQAVIEFVEATWKEQRRAVSGADVAGYFADEVEAATVRQTLARAVKRGRLASPMRGVFEPADKDRLTVTNRGSATSAVSQTQAAADPSPYPPVTLSQLSQQQVSGHIGGVTNGSGSCHNCHKRGPSGEFVTCDSCDKGIRARARNLTTCTACGEALIDVHGSGIHPTCDVAAA